MRKASIILLLFLSAYAATAQNPVLLWAKGFGGVNEDAGTAMAVDNAGNVYTTGYFFGPTDFDPGPGTYTLTSNGWYDIYVSKLDANGNFLWAQKFGSPNYESGLGLKTDAAGNIYITGYYRGTIDFNPGAGTFNMTSNGGSDFFVLKLDPSGNFIWAKGFGGPSDDFSYSIGIDGGGRVHVTGYFQGTVDFDPGPGIANLTATGTYDIFVTRLDASGNYVWAKKLGSGHAFHSSVFYNQCTIGFDPSGNICVAGAYLGTGDFDPGAGTATLTSLGGTDIFLVKLDASGNLIWAKSMGGSSDDYCFGIAIDNAGNICTTGTFTGLADFNPGPGAFTLNSAATNDIFVSKLDNNGNFIWAKRIGGSGADWGNSISIDASGNIYTTGYFSGSVDFDPGAGSFLLNGAGGIDIFVSKLDPSGNFLLALAMGGPTTDMGTEIYVDGSENIYVEGIFSQTADFDPNPPVYNITSAGDNDVFVVKLDQHCLPVVSITATPSTPVCAGTAIDFTATPVNGGSAPVYQWQVNGNNVGTNSPTFSTNTLSNGDVVTVIMTSNAVCANPNTATSNAITVEVNPVVTPQVTISASPSTTICAGSSITFTAIPENEGSAPVYQWKVNGVNVGANSTSFTSSTLVNGDIVTVELLSNALCASPALVTSTPLTITVNPLLAPSVNISANPPGSFCAGTPVTFTASPTYGGGAPSYQWLVNGINTGSNSPVFTSNTLNSGDQVSVILTSSETCASPLTATSNVLTMVVNPLLTPQVSITASPSTPVCAGSVINFTATPVYGGNAPSYQWKVNGINTGSNSPSFSSSTLNNNDVVTVVMTSNETCVTTSTANSNAITVVVNPILVPAVSIAANPDGPVCAGTPVTFTATPVYGGNAPSYQWKVNGVNAGTNSPTFTSPTLNNNDVISVVLTSNQNCVAPLTANSNTITVAINPLLTPAVTINAVPAGAICPGTPVTFTATTVNGGTAPTYQWKLNGVNVGTNSNTFNSSSLVNGDVVSVVITSNETCLAAPSATSSVTISVTPQVTPAVTINVSPSLPVCPGTTLNFTANPVSGGNTPSYQWKVNGVNVGSNAAAFSASNLVNGDVVTVVMTSSSSCAVPATATSPALNILVNPPLTPGVTIAASPAGPVCTGTPVSFTATPINGGSTPSYQWKVNGVNVGTNSPSYNSSGLNNNDIVSVVMTSVAACASPSTATGSHTMAVNPLLTPTVNITANPAGPVCAGTTVNFTSTATNTGNNPVYQWKVNGVNTGTNSPSFSAATLNDGDQVTLEMISNETCTISANAISNIITISITPSVTPSVSILASPAGAVCAGTPVTFNATAANGGSAPSYQWKINGVNAGTNSAVFTSSTLTNGDQVSVSLISNATCALPATATSNTITMVINPLLTPSVSISATPSTPVCPGTLVSFTAASINGGSSPSYQWKVNGVNAGTNSPSFSSAALSNDDVVNVVLTSNVNCASPLTAVSNDIIQVVNNPLTPSVTIAASPSGPVCPGTLINFTASAVNGGTNPVYQWKVNGVNAGTNATTFSTSALANGDAVTVELISNATCASPANVLSAPFIAQVNTVVAPSVFVSAQPAGAVCAGTPVTFNASPSGGGASPIYQWKVNGVNAGTNSAVFTSSTLTNGDQVSVSLISNATCALPATATSNTITMVINPLLTPSVNISATPSTPVCPGTLVNFTAASINGGSSPSYQWKVNGVNTGTNSSSFSSASLSNGDVVNVVLTSNVNCASPLTAVSNDIIQVVNNPLTPSVTIAASPLGPVCPGTLINFTASAVNGGTNPVYHWKVNGVNAGTNATTFSTSALANGDAVTVELISNATCASPTNVLSAPFIAQVNTVVAPSVFVSAQPAGAVCAGTTVTFTASPSGGGASPIYQWKVNGVNAGTNAPVFTASNFADGDIITVQMTSSISCAVPAMVTSNNVTMDIISLVTPSIGISASPSTPVCPGTPINFNAIAVNPGASPNYQWKINGVNAGTNSPNFNSSSLVNADVITVELTSNAACAVPSTALSNSVTVAINPVLIPSVQITATPSSGVCAGTPISFTSTSVNSGTNPVYQWKVNGTNAGSNSPVFNSASLANGDIVSLEMTSNAVCPSQPTVTSNNITANVLAAQVPAVSITATPSGTICPGTMVNFLASPVNGGASPLYQWKVNGVNAGSNAPSFSAASLNNGDVITLEMTSSMACASPASVTSNIITQQVNPVPVPFVNISTNATGAVCPGSAVSFTANAINGGTTPSYQWKVNGINTGTNSNIFTSSSFNNGDTVSVILTSNAACASPLTAVSNVIAVAVNPRVTPAVSIAANTSGPVCTGSTVLFTATPVNGGASPSYKWTLNDMHTGTNSPVFTMNKIRDGDVVKLLMTSSALCASPITVVSNPVDLKIDYTACPSYFFMPTGFTPNNDGKNDMLRPTIDGKLTSYHLLIYNRWGQKVFESTDIRKGWDGKVFGTQTDTNVFVWYCTFQFAGQVPETKKGTVVLIK